MTDWMTSAPSYELGKGRPPLPMASPVDTGFSNPVIQTSSPGRSGVLTTTVFYCSGGSHEWLPWLHRGDGYVTRCIHCSREETFDEVEGDGP